MLCVRAASAALRGWHRLPGATLYVTLEPCAMCAGALLQARVGTLVWGAPNTLLGADGSWVRLLGEGHANGAVASGGSGEGGDDPLQPAPLRPHAFHPRIVVRRGVLADECAGVMRDFFKQRRAQQQAAAAEAL
jgi:tRNA(adenine34) deaminase